MNFPRVLLFSLFCFLLSTQVYGETQKPNSSQESSLSQKKLTALPASGLPKTWLQGVPVTEWEKDKVYVFEFWATWCGPCLAAIPHLEAIHREIEQNGVSAQLIGVNIRDRSSPERLKNFLSKRPTPPSYAIAVDTDQITEKAWLLPLKVVGIPFAVAVKNGEILWRGHPVRLSAKLVREMTRADYSSNPMRSRDEILSDARKRIESITRLFKLEKIEEAETMLQQLIDDESIPASLKNDALEIPAFLALKNGNYTKMNAALRRLAETFPQSFQSQVRVVNFIQTTDDVPAEARDIALALECLNRALALCGDMPSQKSFVYTRISDAYAARGDNEKALDAARKAWELSPEYAYLVKLRQKLMRAPEKRDALELFEKIWCGDSNVPESFLISEKELYSANEAGTQTIEPSVTAEAKKTLAFLRSLKWIQGKCPEQLPKNGVLFIDFWCPPPPGPHNALLSRKPALWLDEKAGNIPGAEIIVVAVERDSGRARKALGFERYKTPHAVAVISNTSENQALLSRFALSEFPSAVALRDGNVIWSGSAQDLPAWVVEEAVKPDYDHTSASLRRSEMLKNFLKTSNALSEVSTLVRQMKFDETRQKINALKEDINRHPQLAMRAAELLISEPFAQGDFGRVGEICEAILNKYPKLGYIAEHQMKILTSSEELQKQNLPVLIHACRNVISAGTPYKTAYLSMLAGFYEEAGETTNAVLAAFAARNASEKYQNFRKAEIRYRNAAV